MPLGVRYSIRCQRIVPLVYGPRQAAIRGMDRRRAEFQLNVVRSLLRSASGSLTVLKNNFAGTQAAEMHEALPLTYLRRSRGTCDVTSAARRSVRGGARGRAL